MPSEPTVLADRYQLLRRLGAGPVGEVWEGRDLVLDQPVAVKVVHGHLAADEAFRARLRSLARDAARVQHPNAVGIHDVDTDGRFVVTELVQGPSTRQLLVRRGTLSPETAMRLAAGVCSALSAAHAAGVLHRDLKPENLLVAPDGGVKVTDFCLAHAASDPGLAAVRYLAPEELATGQADDRSDLYALGCCLYELVCGRPPFDGPTPFAVASAHVSERPRRPRSIRPDIPEELEATIARVLPSGPGLALLGGCGVHYARAMRYRVLGPLEVDADNGPVTLGGAEGTPAAGPAADTTQPGRAGRGPRPWAVGRAPAADRRQDPAVACGAAAAGSGARPGPILTAVTLKADAARSVLDTAPNQADELLAELRGDAKQAIGDLRRVVEDLRPASLDELGPLGALSQQVDRFSRQGCSSPWTPRQRCPCCRRRSRSRPTGSSPRP